MTAAVGLLALVAVLLWPCFLAAAPVAVRFTEAASHGFLILRSVNGALLATGDLLQVARGGAVESRMVFRFGKCRPPLDEVIASHGKDPLLGEHHRFVKQGAVFDLPPDVYNGLVLIAAKNLPKGAGETIHVVAFTPAPRLIRVELIPAGEHNVLIGDLTKSAVHYVLKPRLGSWLKLFATLLGRVPPDSQAWILTDEVPAFVRFEGTLYTAGPVWRIELASPRWPDATERPAPATRRP